MFFLLATSGVLDFAHPAPAPAGAAATAGQGTTAETGPIEVDLEGLVLEPGFLFNNNHSLVLLAANVGTLLGSVPTVGGILGTVLLVLLTFWFVAAFRRVYATGWLLALGGSLVLFVLWAALLIIAALVTFALGLLTV